MSLKAATKIGWESAKKVPKQAFICGAIFDGSILAAQVSYSGYKYYRGNIDGCQFRSETVCNAASAIGSTGGSVTGATAGTFVGATIGSIVPVVGTAIGGVAGGIIGGMFAGTAGSFAGMFVGKQINHALDANGTIASPMQQEQTTHADDKKLV